METIQKISENEIGIPQQVEVRTLESLLADQDSAQADVDRLIQALTGATQKKTAIDALVAQAIALGVKTQEEIDQNI